MMLSYQTILVVSFALLQNTNINAFTIPKNMNTISFGGMQTQLYSESQGAFSGPSPETFREAEVLGLRLMQEGQHDQALKGKTLFRARGSIPTHLSSCRQLV